MVLEQAMLADPLEWVYSWSEPSGGLWRPMKTMWFLRIGLVLAFTLASCAPSTTDTVADGADKSATATSHPFDGKYEISH